MRAYIPFSLITFSLLILGLIVCAPLLSWIERECIDHIKLLLLSSLMILLFLLGIAVLLFFVGPVHLSVKGKLITSTLLLLTNASGSYPKKKKIFNNFCNSSFPSLIHPDSSIACSPTDIANLFGSYFPTNSSLSDSNAPDPPAQPLSNPIPSIIISAHQVCRVRRSLKTNKASGFDGIPPRFLKEFAEELVPGLCRLFASFLFPALILLFGIMHLFSLFLRGVTAPIPPTIALLLSLRLLLRFSKLCLTPTSSNISNLTIFFPITSMASLRLDLQGIFFPILLMPGHPLLGTSENHSSSLLISLRHLTESGIRLC